GRRSCRHRATWPYSLLLFGRFLTLLFGRFLTLALERSAENVAQSRAGIGGAVLGDRLLLLGDLERLDRDLHLAGAPIELDDARAHLLTDRKTVGALLGAVAREFGTLDECGEIGTHDGRFDAAFLHFGDLASNHRTLLDLTGSFGGERIAFELFDTERSTLLLDIHVENLRLDLVARLVLVDHVLAGRVPLHIENCHQ